MTNLANNLKRIREEKSMTQQEAADKLYVTRQCISRWENGKTVPDIESLKKLTEIYTVTLDQILEDRKVQMIAVQDALDMMFWKKYTILYSSLTGLLLLGIVSLLWLNGWFSSAHNEQNPVMHQVIGEVIAVDTHHVTIDIVDFGTYTFDFSLFTGSIYHVNMNSLNVEGMLVGDVILMRYLDDLEIESLYHIQILDRDVENSVLGFFVNSTGHTYHTFDEVIAADDRFGICFFSFIDHRFNHFTYQIDTTQNQPMHLVNLVDINAFRKQVRSDITIYVDERYITKEIQVFLITSNGLMYQETIDPFMHSIKSYSGELTSPVRVSQYSHTLDVLFNIQFINVQSAEMFTILEYDVMDQLIQTTSFDDVKDYMTHKVLGQTAYTEIRFDYYMGETYHFYRTFEVLVGDTIDVYVSDAYGMVNTYRKRID
jgi:transcriptional regulator with XRE-family HTH domain